MSCFLLWTEVRVQSGADQDVRRAPFVKAFLDAGEIQREAGSGIFRRLGADGDLRRGHVRRTGEILP
jgi:hypothetical protein